MRNLSEAISGVRSLADEVERTHPRDLAWLETASIARRCADSLAASHGGDTGIYLGAQLGYPLQVLSKAAEADTTDPATARWVLARYTELGSDLWSALEEHIQLVGSARDQLAFVSRPGTHGISRHLQSRWRAANDQLMSSAAAVFEAVTVNLTRHDPVRFHRLSRTFDAGSLSADRIAKRIAEAFELLPSVPRKYDSETRRSLAARSENRWWVPHVTVEVAPFVRYLIMPPLTLFPLGVVLLLSQLRAWHTLSELVEEVAKVVE